jgi:hypothetical protein
MGSALNMVSRHNPDVGIMPQAMNAYRFCDAGTLYCGAEDRLYRRQGYMTILLLPLKQPFRGTIFFPVLPQMLKSRLG